MPVNFQVPMENAVEMTSGNETGICMSISSFWLQRCRTVGGIPGGGDLFFTDWRHYETMGVAFETILADYTAATGGDAGINTQNHLIRNSLNWHGQWEQQLGLTILEINWGTADTLNFLISLMEGGGAGRYLITCYATQNGMGNALQLNGGHTMAFCYGPPGTAKSFMDPNGGQWTVPRAYNWMADIIGYFGQNYGNYNQWVLVSTV